MSSFHFRGVRRYARSAALPMLALVLTSVAASAQEIGSVAVLGGVSQFDLSGVGTTSMVSFRGTTALDRLLVAEAAVAYQSYATQGGHAASHALPEVQAQLQWPRAGIRPYVGAGVGASISWSDGGVAGTDTELTFSTAGGVRLPVKAGWMLQGELRIRAIDPWVGTTADWQMGVVGRF